MDNAPTNGYKSLFLSTILGIFSWFTPERVDIGLKVITAIGAIIAAIFAAYYHYYAAKEKKERIRLLQKNKKKKDDEEVLD